MNVTKTERKESTKHCCGSGCRRRDSAEHEEEGGALIGQRITENNVTNADRNVNRLLERIVSPENLNNAYKRVVRNKGAGGVDGMKVEELLQYLKDNGKEIRESVLAGKYKPAPVRRVEIPKDNGKKRMLGIPTAVDRVIQQAIAQVLIPIYEPEFVETSYYKLANMGNWLKQIDEWMRRRIRMVFWKRWKRVKTRYHNLEKLGISHSNAGILANSRKGYWRIAGSPILNTALSNERLEKGGFQYFFSYYKSVTA